MRACSVIPSPQRACVWALVVLLCGCLLPLAACGEDLDGSVWRGRNAVGIDMQLEFLTGSDCRVSLIEDQQVREQSTVGWRLDGDQVSLDLDGGTIVLTVDDNIMTAGAGDSVQTLYRQTEAITGSPVPGGDAAGLDTPPLPTTVASGVAADLSGSYDELVERANGLYDEGDALLQAGDFEQGVEYFAAVAQVYQAAWELQPGDPVVGTDWATALFYSGDFDGAVAQIRVVLEANPDFQAAWFNFGNYLQHMGRIAESSGDADEAARLTAEARDAYETAAAIDPSSDTGVEAAARAAEFAE